MSRLWKNYRQQRNSDQRDLVLADAAVDAGCDWCDRNHDIRVPDRLHRQSGSRLERLGLQRASGQSVGTDLSAVLCAVAAGGTGRNRHGRLDPVPKVRGRMAALQTDLTDKHTI